MFSFQLAHRLAQLAPPQSVLWTDVWLDSLPDLVAAKMVALVERGAPRDFRDIYTLCQARVTTLGARLAYIWEDPNLEYV